MENHMENRMHYEMEFRFQGKTMMQVPIQLENTWGTSSVQLLFLFGHKGIILVVGCLGFDTVFLGLLFSVLSGHRIMKP